MSARIFINYAREDAPHADSIYDFLKIHAHEPWMDRRDILPGEEFEYAIAAALKESDFFLSILSPRSVSKRGYLRKEMKLAAEAALRLLPGDLYFLPLVVEECEGPPELARFQRLELSDPQWTDRLLAAIDRGLKLRQGEA